MNVMYDIDNNINCAVVRTNESFPAVKKIFAGLRVLYLTLPIF